MEENIDIQEDVVVDASIENTPQEIWLESLKNVSKREIVGKRKIKASLDKFFSRFVLISVLCILLVAIVWQAASVAAEVIENKRENEFYEDLAQKLSLSTGDTGLVSTLYGEMTITDLPDYDQMKNGAVISDKSTLTSAEKKELAVYNAKLAILKKQNPDTVGWIYIPGTNIDYPIVLAPKEDPEYYLDHSFSGANYGIGAIYMEPRCYGSILQNRNTIIAGHNLRLNGIMFNQLVKFGEEDFFKTHSEIYIYTEEGKFVFNLFSFYRVNYKYNFRRVSFLDDNDFVQYLEAMRQNSWYERQGVTFSGNDRILTLYTCTNDNVKTNRYVAVAVLKESLLNQ